MRSEHNRSGAIRRNIYLDAETDRWLTEQATRTPGGRSGVVRALVQAARERGGLGGLDGQAAASAGTDREALIDEIVQRVMAALVVDAARTRSGATTPAGGQPAPAGLSDAELAARRSQAARTARRFIDS